MREEIAPSRARWYHLTRPRSEPETSGTFLKRADEPSQFWFYGWPGVGRAVQKPVRKITTRTRGAPHELQIPNGVWLALEQRLLPPGREIKPLPKFVGSLAGGIGSVIALGYIGLPAPYSIHPLNLAIRAQKSYFERGRRQKLIELIESDYRFDFIRARLRSGKIDEPQALAEAEQLRRGINDLIDWRKQTLARRRKDPNQSAPALLADLLADVRDPDAPLAYRSVPLDPLRQFMNGDWKKSRAFKRKIPSDEDFTLEQIFQLIDLEIRKQVDLTSIPELILNGGDLSQVKQTNPIIEAYLEDPARLEDLRQRAARAGERPLRWLLMKDIEEQYRQMQLAALGLELSDS